MGKQTVELFAGTLALAVTDSGFADSDSSDREKGRTFLVLHGGAGPATVAGLAAALARHGRVVVPTHPGFNGEPRPDRFARIDDLVLAYLALLDALDLSDVLVVGNSVGGWIAAELALRRSPRIAGIVLLSAVGIETGVPGRPIVDPMALAPADRMALSFHDPARFAVAPAGPEAAAIMAANQRTLRVYAGDPFMHDPTLRARLAGASIPALVVWGESDGIVDAEYGRRYAESIPGARFALVPEAGHFPQIERLDAVVRLITELATTPS